MCYSLNDDRKVLLARLHTHVLSTALSLSRRHNIKHVDCLVFIYLFVHFKNKSRVFIVLAIAEKQCHEIIAISVEWKF